jgi:hypothetical protein
MLAALVLITDQTYRPHGLLSFHVSSYSSTVLFKGKCTTLSAATRLILTKQVIVDIFDLPDWSEIGPVVDIVGSGE